MRIRPLIALSVAALAALTLAGCSSSPSASPSPTTSAAADLCSAKVKAGAASDAVKVTGDVGKEATATFSKPLSVTALQSSVVTEGSGDKVKSGDIVQFALTEFNAQTGAKNGAIGQKAGTLLPQPISADSVLGQVLGCAKEGTRIVATIPGDENNKDDSRANEDRLKKTIDKAAGAQVLQQLNASGRTMTSMSMPGMAM